ncbi:MAG: DUF5787 family protein [Haloferacaceae archaeon]
MVSEYAFELALCARVEERSDNVVARQLGGGVAAPGRRVVDVVGVVPGSGFAERARITDETIPPAVVEGDAGAGRAVRASEAVDLPAGRREGVLDRAVEVGFLERTHRGGTVRYRQRVRYPDGWFSALIAVENKPDLGRPGALEEQLAHDAGLALFDRVVLATESHVTRAHLNRIPDAVGVWRVDHETGDREVVREAEPLPVDEPGVEPVERHPGRTDVRVVSPAAKARVRRRIAERAYGKGWRPAPPACARCEPTADGRPGCAAFGRVVDPARDCEGCAEREPADPPDVDRAALRDARTPWVAEPAGVAREQSGLGDF